MRILVVGLGSIGKRHVQNLRLIDPAFKISVLRQHNKTKFNPIFAPLVQHIFLDKKQALAWQPEITLIANPAPFHVATALEFVKIGSHIFVEKPLSVDLKDTDRLIYECRKRNKVLMVGYVLRFSQALEILKKKVLDGSLGKILSSRVCVGQNLANWRVNSDYRKNVSAQKKLGGGVVFELSHEIDYVRWLLGEITHVQSFMGRLSHLQMDVEDTAQILLRLKSKALVSVHLDMIDHAKNRSCRIIGSKGTIIWEDSPEYQLKFYSAAEKKWFDLRASETMEQNDMLVNELRHFLACVKLNKKPMVTGEDGQRVLKILLAIKQSASSGKVVKI